MQGRPPANITWWRDNAVLIDNSFETQSEGYEAEIVINDLEIAKLDRYHNGVILTCQAKNDIQVPPANSSVQIRMHCKYKIGRQTTYCKIQKYLLF